MDGAGPDPRAPSHQRGDGPDDAGADRGDARFCSTVLARADLFGCLSDGVRTDVAARCRPQACPSGQRIFSRGDVGTTMYVVAAGAVLLSASSAGGGRMIFDVVRPPQTFGELSVIDGGVRIATATARQATTLVVVPGAVVRGLLRDDPDFAVAILGGLVDLVRRLDDQLADRTLVDLRTRVVKFLAATATTAIAAAAVGHRTDRRVTMPDPLAEVRIDLPVTQTELAGLVGGSRQHINRIIGDLARSGAIRRRGTRIVAVRPDLLRSSSPDV